MTADLVSFVRDGVKRPEYRGKGCILGKCPSWMEIMLIACLKESLRMEILCVGHGWLELEHRVRLCCPD